MYNVHILVCIKDGQHKEEDGEAAERDRGGGSQNSLLR